MSKGRFSDRKYLLLDLDGTVTDSSEGIIRSVLHALSFYGIQERDLTKLRAFIGPPLTDSFEEIYGFSHERAAEAVERYREYYRDTGIYENRVYDGMEEFFRKAKAAGHEMILATSKPEIFAKRILAHFGIERYFTHCCGSELDGRRVKKAEVIRYALDCAGNPPCEQAVMIGDRCYDAAGARECGIDCIGVLFGFGSREELTAAGAAGIAEDPKALWRLFAGAAD